MGENAEVMLHAAVLKARASARLSANLGEWVSERLGTTWEIRWRVLPDGREAFGMRGKRAPGKLAVATVVKGLPFALIPEGEPKRDEVSVALVFYQREGMRRCLVCEKEPASTEKGSFVGMCAWCTAVRRTQMQKGPSPAAAHGWFAETALTADELAEIEKFFPSRGQ